MATKPHALTAVEGAFVLVGSGEASHSSAQIADTSKKLQDFFSQTVAKNDPGKLPEPDLCSLGLEKSGAKLYRFYWFNLFTIGGKQYGLGANLHSKGVLGSMWMTGLKVTDTPELHPHRAPTIPNQPAWLAALKKLVANGTFHNKLKK